MNTAQVQFNEIDLTFSATAVPLGRSGFMGVTKMGPPNRPDILINSWTAFVKTYGGLMPDNDFPLLCKRALDGGAALRICSVRHYADITDPGSITAQAGQILPVYTHTLSGTMGAGHTATFTLGAKSVDQPFTSTQQNTMKLLVDKIVKGFPDDVATAVSYDPLVLTVTPKTGIYDGVLAISGESPAQPEVLGKTTMMNCGSLGADGDATKLYLLDKNNIPILQIAYHVKTAADTTTDLLTAALLATLGGGWTSTEVAGSNFKIQAPIGSGASTVGQKIQITSPTQLSQSILYDGKDPVPEIADNPTVVMDSFLGAVATDGGGLIFITVPKYPGAAYNDLRQTIAPPSNNLSGYFNLYLDLIGDSSFHEEYTNLIIPGTPTVKDSDYLAKPIAQSKLASFAYNDLSAMTAPVIPKFGVFAFDGGTNGDEPIDVDYIGDSFTKTGLQSFNTVDDIMQIAYGGPPAEESGIHIAGSAYADNRKDLMYWIHMGNTLITEDEAVGYRRSTGIDSSYTAFYLGGIRVVDPLSGVEKGISEIGDVMALAAQSDYNFGPWYSFAGPRRGILKNVLGIVNNFGSSGNLLGMNQLANANINTVINNGSRIDASTGLLTQGGKNLLWGNFTAQVATSTLSFQNVRRLIIHLKKILGPMVEQYLEEPNDFLTWRKLYMEVKPVLDDLGIKRAFYGQEGEGWEWQGDQFVTKLEDLVINNATDVGLGKYKVNLFVKDVVSLQWIEVNIILTNSGVSFEEAITQITT